MKRHRFDIDFTQKFLNHFRGGIIPVNWAALSDAFDEWRSKIWLLAEDGEQGSKDTNVSNVGELFSGGARMETNKNQYNDVSI